MEFPHTAVIYAATLEDAECLRDFFVDNGFRWMKGGSGEFPKNLCWDISGGSTCYDIEGKIVMYSDRSYYEGGGFERDYPNLIPEDPKWFLCTVADFIAMCNGYSINVEFDVADEGDLEAMLGSGV